MKSFRVKNFFCFIICSASFLSVLWSSATSPDSLPFSVSLHLFLFSCLSFFLSFFLCLNSLNLSLKFIQKGQERKENNSSFPPSLPVVFSDSDLSSALLFKALSEFRSWLLFAVTWQAESRKTEGSREGRCSQRERERRKRWKDRVGVRASTLMLLAWVFVLCTHSFSHSAPLSFYSLFSLKGTSQ